MTQNQPTITSPEAIDGNLAVRQFLSLDKAGPAPSAADLDDFAYGLDTDVQRGLHPDLQPQPEVAPNKLRRLGKAVGATVIAGALTAGAVAAYKTVNDRIDEGSYLGRDRPGAEQPVDDGK